MKAIIQKDRRSAIDRRFDEMWNKLCREARLTPIQSNLVAKYLREIMTVRFHEIQSADDMSWLLALIEVAKWGTDVTKGAKRLIQAQKKSAEIRNDAFGHECVDANGFWQSYDGCALEHLQSQLRSKGVEYDMAL